MMITLPIAYGAKIPVHSSKISTLKITKILKNGLVIGENLSMLDKPNVLNSTRPDY